MKAATIEKAGKQPFETHVPVLIVGGGACGLVAALKAADGGADVLVLERDVAPAGSTSLSSGFVPAAGTRFQKAAGIEDSPKLFAEDIRKKAGGEAVSMLVALVANHCGKTLEWLADDHGLEWVVLDDFLYPGHSRHRMHAVPERTGEALMARLVNAAETAGVAIATEAPVTTLLVDDRKIKGVEVARPDGKHERIGCDVLILACSGYGGSRELVGKHIPEMAGAIYFGHAGNRGDALVWGELIGAATCDLAGYQGHGSVATPHGVLISWALMMQGAIQVNLAGRRFSNEHEGYSEQAAKVLVQPQGVVWNIYDSRIHAAAHVFEDYRKAEALGAIREAANVCALADITGLPSRPLAETLAEIEDLRLGGGKDRFGRRFAGEEPFRPPYHAVKVTAALFHTQGGLKIDEKCRVVDKAGRPFENLFAGGGAACGVSGPKAQGYLSGNGLLTAVTLGAIAGEQAAKLVGRQC